MKASMRARRTKKVPGQNFRLRLRRPVRAIWTVLLCVTTVFFLPAVVTTGVDLFWRGLSVAGLVTSLAGLRIIWGPAVVVRPSGLRVYRNWPLRREFAWYRVHAVDIIPGFWNLEVELNSGERLELPCVDHLDTLYEAIEAYRTDLDQT